MGRRRRSTAMEPHLSDTDLQELIGLPKAPAPKVLINLPPKDQYNPQPGSYLAIHAMDDEDYSVHLANILDADYRTWLNVAGRFHRLEREKALPLPFTSRKKCRQVVLAALDRFFERRAAKELRSHPRNEREYCVDLIYRVIDKWYDPWSPDLPLWKGKPIRLYRLTKLMGLIDDKLKEETHKKYAKLWLLSRRLFQAKPTFTPQDLAFLKRVDRHITYTAAVHSLRKQAH
jgi:hypothetical protein